MVESGTRRGATALKWAPSLAFFLVAVIALTVRAASQTYQDSNATNSWDLSTLNWDAGVAAWTNDNTAVFGGTGEVVDVGGAIVTGGLTFTAGGYTIADADNDGSLTFTTAASTAVLNSVGNNTISENIFLSGAGTKAFNVAPGGSLTLSGNISEVGGINNVTYNRTAAGTFSWTVSGNNSYTGVTSLAGSGGTLNIASAKAFGTGVLTESTSAFNLDNTYGAAITLGNDLRMGSTTAAGLTVIGTNNLTFGSLSLANAAAAGIIKTVTVNGRGTLTVSGILQETGTGGTQNLTKAGTGTLAITGGSTFAGGSVLGTTPAVLGGVIVGNKASLGTGTIDLRLTTFSATADLTGANRIANALTTGASGQTTVFTGSNSIEFGGAYTANVANKTHVNNITDGTLTFSGTQNLSAGATATLTLLGTGSTIFTNGISNSAGSASLVYGGTGTLLLQGSGTYTGSTTFNNGTVTLDRSTGGSLPSATAFNLGGTFIFKGASSGTSAQTLAGPTFTTTTTGAGSGSSIVIDSNGGAGATLTLGDTWTRNAQATLHVDLASGNAVLASNPGMTASIVATTPTAAAYVTVKDATGTGFATVLSGNVVRYTSASTLTTADPGVSANVVTKVTDADYSGGVLTLAGASSANTLQLDTSAGPGTLDLNGTILTLGSRAVLATGDSNYTIQNGTLGASATEVIVHQFSSGTLTINASITDSSGSVTKAGTGALVVRSAQLYTGTTTVNAGRLIVQNSAALGTTTGLTSVSNGATLAIDGTGGDLSIGAETLRLMGNGASGQSGALVNVGGTNSYGGQLVLFGGTTIASDAGTLNLTSSSALTTAVAGGVPLTLTGGGNGSISSAITATGITGVTTLTKSGAGAWTLSGANTYTGQTTITAGTLALSGTGSIDKSRLILVGATAAQGTAKLDVTGTSSGGITLAAGQTLGGHGTVVGRVAGLANSTVAPGAATGILAVQNGDFTLGGGALSIDVGKSTGGPAPVAGADYDQLVVTGTGSAGDGSSKVDLTGSILMINAGPGLELGDVLYILNNSGSDAIVGTFAKQGGLAEALAEGAQFTAGYYTFQITYEADAGIGLVGGNDVALETVAAPEPSSLALVGLMSIGLFPRRRRSRLTMHG